MNELYNILDLDFIVEEDEEIDFEVDDVVVIGGGCCDYNQLKNKPQINNVTILNNKTGAELGLQDKIHDITEQEIDTIIYGG